MEGIEDVKLQLNGHSRVFSALTAEIRKVVSLLPPLHAVQPLAAAQAQVPVPNFNLPLREVTDLSTLNMLLADKANLASYVSVARCNLYVLYGFLAGSPDTARLMKCDCI